MRSGSAGFCPGFPRSSLLCLLHAGCVCLKLAARRAVGKASLVPQYVLFVCHEFALSIRSTGLAIQDGGMRVCLNCGDLFRIP